MFPLFKLPQQNPVKKSGKVPLRLNGGKRLYTARSKEAGKICFNQKQTNVDIDTGNKTT